jgi:hypothetical protein
MTIVWSFRLGSFVLSVLYMSTGPDSKILSSTDHETVNRDFCAPISNISVSVTNNLQQNLASVILFGFDGVH